MSYHAHNYKSILWCEAELKELVSCFIRLGNAIKFVNVVCTYSHFIITL